MASKKDLNQKGSNPKYATITRAELAGGYFGKHVAFVIKTPSGCQIKRRYTDFEWLRHSLCQMYPGAFIPPIPPKLAVSMWPQGYLLMRKRELQQFLQRVDIIPYLKKQDVTVFFLQKHNTDSFDKSRKKWEKQHQTPSTSQIYEKLIATFPKIHETKTPDDMETRCKLSTQLIDESIKQFEIMAKSSNNFIDRTKECCDAISEFRNSFDDLLRVEYDETQTQYIAQKRIDISLHFEQWKSYKMDEINNMNIYYIPTIHRALNDLGVIKEILMTRDKIRLDYKVAKKAADIPPITKSQLARMHRHIQTEKDLRHLKIFVDKLVLGQLNVIFCANTRRWKKSCVLFAQKHSIALEKVLGSWTNLTNKILKDKGHFNDIVKVITVEKMKHINEKNSVLIRNETNENNNNNKTNEKNSVLIINKTTESNNVEKWGNDDLLRWIKTIGLKAQWLEIMIKTIQQNGCTGKDWFMAKNFKELAKILNITQPMLANRVFREFKKAKQKQKQIHNDNDENVLSIDDTDKAIWELKAINEWTCDELKEWIKSLNLRKEIESKISESITEQQVNGHDFNLTEEAIDIMDALEISKDCAVKIFSALEKVRANISNTPYI